MRNALMEEVSALMERGNTKQIIRTGVNEKFFIE